MPIKIGLNDLSSTICPSFSDARESAIIEQRTAGYKQRTPFVVAVSSFLWVFCVCFSFAPVGAAGYHSLVQKSSSSVKGQAKKAAIRGVLSLLAKRVIRLGTFISRPQHSTRVGVPKVSVSLISGGYNNDH